MIFIGVILLIAAVVCFFVARGQAGRAQAMSSADTYTAQMLADLYKQVSGSVGADALAQQCEVAGVIECDKPLTGPVSGAACVAFSRSVVREYEEDVTTTDDKGHRETKTEQRTETMESEDRRVPFWVRDDSGRVLVNPDEAELDLVDTANRFENAPPAAASGRTRTLGYRYAEQALTVGTRVYVLGCAMDGHGQVQVAHNPRGKQQFIISRRTEQELMRSAASSARGFYYASLGCGAAGLLLLGLGLLQ